MKMSEDKEFGEILESERHTNYRSLLPGTPGRRAGDEGHCFQAIWPLTPRPLSPEDWGEGEKECG